ncbi:hypothetical protein HNR46_002601 [Haloferula luteola]|uniref:Uncharacterized protein n=1 Tax=Haloferula luteola TaxID=595692 RepID=A0A840V5P7_9BACT|nr:hypothetical protein [Haloferula luteola]MBB5352356.1 hypothetical protein [Haloferula luteola]
MSVSSMFTARDHSHSAEIEQWREVCFNRTIDALRQAGWVTEEEIRKLRERFLLVPLEDHPEDLLVLLARMQGTEEERLGIEVARLSHGLASLIPGAPPLIPFAGKLMAPSSFYEAYTQVYDLSRVLRSPVIYAEDTDAIGTASLNPVASLLMADYIMGVVNKRFAIRPFVTSARLDYESWAFLTRKHFGL